MHELVLLVGLALLFFIYLVRVCALHRPYLDRTYPALRKSGRVWAPEVG